MIRSAMASVIGVTVIGMSVMFGAAVFAQNTPGTHQDNSGLNGSLSRGDLEKLSGDHTHDTAGDGSDDSPQARAKAKAEGAKLAASLRLACEVGNARLVVAGTRKSPSGNKEVETRVYEVSCNGGTGYLLETQGSEAPIGISCLSAEEARAADVAKGKEPGFFCRLPENRDVYAAVASLIAAAGATPCVVHDLKSFGRSESTQSEYSEVACEDGTGLLLRTPLPGSQAKVTVTNCADAAKQGIKCRLTNSGPVEAPVTLDTFKTGLAEHGVACKIEQIRMIGQEDHLKRYVVEYRCAEQAARVAFLPLQGNSNPYESIDCAAAAADHQVTCQFAAAK
jgi:hypothetical protein